MEADVGGTRLWFDVLGSALVLDGDRMRERPTVVMVHGGPGGYDHSYLRPGFDRLAEHAQVVYLDLRGHGRSTWGDVREWTLEDCADDIEQLCTALGITRPVVLGHSLGAAIVLLHAIRHPGRAAGTVVQSGFGRWDHDRLVAAFRHLAGDEVAALATRSFGGQHVTDEESARVLAAFGPHRPDPGRQAHVRTNGGLNPPGMDRVRELDVVDLLPAVASPVLVSVGALDPVTPVAAAREIVEGLAPGIGRLDVVEGAGHFTWMDAGEDTGDPRRLRPRGEPARVQLDDLPGGLRSNRSGPSSPGCGRLRPLADRGPDARRQHPRAHLPAHPPLTCPDSKRIRHAADHRRLSLPAAVNG